MNFDLGSGAVITTIAVENAKVTSVAFGKSDLKSLLVTAEDGLYVVDDIFRSTGFDLEPYHYVL